MTKKRKLQQSDRCTGSSCRTSSLPNAKVEPHDCPFQREINDNKSDDYCDCCSDCRQLCGDEV